VEGLCQSCPPTPPSEMFRWLTCSFRVTTTRRRHAFAGTAFQQPRRLRRRQIS
jgi:hypothetical protein